jgi:signal transduction histidine kinase
VKILVAEDNAFYACMVEAAARGWGYEVVIARDGAEAWQALCGDDPPKLAIVDWLMPGLDGLELCRRLRATPRAEPTYVIMLTAKGGKENLIAGLTAGADDYLVKPFDLDELRSRIQVGRRIVDLQANLAARVKELEYALSGAQKMEAVGRLAGGVAHDFNNLLTVIISGSDILLDQLRHPGQREFVEMIKQAGERGASLTRQLLAFSRRQVLRPEILQLNSLLNDLHKLLRRLIGEDIELVKDLDPDLGRIKADPGQMEQVVMNLVVNARDAMPTGGRLTLRTRNVDSLLGEDSANGIPPRAYVLLEVADTGCGMDDHVKAHLFEPFFTTKDLHKGTGLGLATVYGIVNQTGGRIGVESEPGRGATFRIYLPRQEAEMSAPEVGVGQPTVRGKRETVLLVEDEDSVRMMARQILLNHCYTVLEARDGEEALRVSSRWPEPIHLMVTDVVMPRTNGHQLADRLLPQRPGMKVLFVSGYTDDAVVRHSVAESGQPFLQKPFTPSLLASKVREVLDHSGEFAKPKHELRTQSESLNLQ